VQTKTQRKENDARIQVARMTAAILTKTFNFQRTGFSDRTIDALWAAGVEAPESLVHMSEEEIRKIPGIGKVSFKAICAYRDRFRIKLNVENENLPARTIKLRIE
jgi:hypothetical protein